MSFKEDLREGERAELYILSLIQRKYPSAYKIEGYCKHYDIYIPEKNIGVEVKKDYKSTETGNIVIEIEYGGKPSALSTTKAQHWVFLTEEELIWTTPSLLKQCTKHLRPATFTGKGDTKQKKAHLVKIPTLKQYATLISKNTHKVYYT